MNSYQVIKLTAEDPDLYGKVHVKEGEVQVLLDTSNGNIICELPFPINGFGVTWSVKVISSSNTGYVQVRDQQSTIDTKLILEIPYLSCPHMFSDNEVYWIK